MSKDSIRLSPKHGLNAFIPVCFWCGQEKNMLCLPGRINRADDKAPSRMLIDYEPCDKCAELFSKGIQVIGVVDKPPHKNMPPISIVDGHEVYPTGTSAVVSPEFINEVLLKPNGDEAFLDEVKKKGKVLLNNETCLQIIDMIKSWQDDEGEPAAEETEELDNEDSKAGVSDDGCPNTLSED